MSLVNANVTPKPTLIIFIKTNGFKFEKKIKIKILKKGLLFDIFC